MIFLLISFSFIALITIGGGYAMIPLIQEEAINIHGWITQHDFINILAISQITPGAISINSATFIGFSSYGFLGAILASIGLILPSTIIILFLAPILKKYEKNRLRITIFSGVRPVVTGLIASAIFIMAKSVFISEDTLSYSVMMITAVGFIILRTVKIKPLFILVLCAIAGILI